MSSRQALPNTSRRSRPPDGLSHFSNRRTAEIFVNSSVFDDQPGSVPERRTTGSPHRERGTRRTGREVAGASQAGRHRRYFFEVSPLAADLAVGAVALQRADPGTFDLDRAV